MNRAHLTEAKAWREIGQKYEDPYNGFDFLCLSVDDLLRLERITERVHERMRARIRTYITHHQRYMGAFPREGMVENIAHRPARAMAAYWLALDTEAEGR